MGLSVRVSIEASGADLKAIADREADLTEFHRNVNVLTLQRGSQRLAAKVKGDLRTGRLLRSLSVGGPENIAQLGHNFGEVGSALEYARKVNDGGMIYPSQGRALAVPVTEKTKRYGLWPRDVDPGRTLLQLIPREGKPPVLVNPDDDEEMWVLLPSVDWGEGYRFLEFRTEDLQDIEAMFWEHLGMEGG